VPASPVAPAADETPPASGDTVDTVESSSTSSRSRAAWIFGLALAAIAGFLVASWLVDDGDDTVQLGDPADPPAELTDDQLAALGDLPSEGFAYFDGSEGSFADFDGTPVVINFFASTCAPCVREMPEFERAFATYGDDVAFLGLNHRETVEDGRTVAEATRVTYPLASDPDGSLLAAFNGLAMPTTVLVDADGNVKYSRSVVLDEEALNGLIEEHLL
jgi:peroxiredoxin